MKAFIVDRYGSNDGVRSGEMQNPELRTMTCWSDSRC